MPTYEFRCPQGHEFEKFYRSISGAEATAQCPVCAEQAERMMSATGFAFKGSGFYLTDYGKNAHRDKGTPAPASGESGGEGAKAESAKAESKGDGGTADAKPASGSEPKAAAPAAGEAKPAPAPAPKKSTGE